MLELEFLVVDYREKRRFYFLVLFQLARNALNRKYRRDLFGTTDQLFG